MKFTIHGLVFLSMILYSSVASGQKTPNPTAFVGLDFGNSVESMVDQAFKGKNTYAVEYKSHFSPALLLGIEVKQKWSVAYTYNQGSDIHTKRDWVYDDGFYYIADFEYKKPEYHGLTINMYPIYGRGFHAGLSVVRRSGFDVRMSQEYDYLNYPQNPNRPPIDWWHLSIKFKTQAYTTLGLGIGYDFKLGERTTLSTGFRYYYVDEKSIHKDISIKNSITGEYIEQAEVLEPSVEKTRYVVPLDFKLSIRYDVFEIGPIKKKEPSRL